jgi:hypothetical protein
MSRWVKGYGGKTSEDRRAKKQKGREAVNKLHEIRINRHLLASDGHSAVNRFC